MYLLATFILQNFLKIYRTDFYEHVPFSGQKWSICHEKKFFLVQTIIIILIYLLVLFIVEHLKKFLQQIQSFEDVPFLGPKRSIFPNFFWKIIKIILIYILAPFIVQNFKKILPADQELRRCTIFAPKMTDFPKMSFFFQKTC